MDALLLGIYAFFVWLIFIKFKWLPWNTTSQVIVVIIPVVALTCMILLLNVFAPSSSDLRVFKYTVAVVPQVRGRVIEVPVEEGNRLVKKGDVLFRIDPTPYQLEVNSLQAQLATAIAQQREVEASSKGTRAKIVEARSGIDQAGARIAEAKAKLDLARKRVAQYRELAASGAGASSSSNRRRRPSANSKASLLPHRARKRNRVRRKCRRRRRTSRCNRNWAPKLKANMRRWRRSGHSSSRPNGTSSKR